MTTTAVELPGRSHVDERENLGEELPPAAAARFGGGVTLFGFTLSNAACVGITCAFAVVFLALAVIGFGAAE